MSRRRGEGTVEERSPGRWRFRAVDGSGGRFTSPAEYESEKIALEELATFRKRVLNGELVAVRGMTLGDYYEHHFLPRLERLVQRRKRRPGTLGFYKSHWPRLEKLAALPLRSLDVPTITRWAERLGEVVDRPEAYLAVLRAILQTAVSVDFLLESNPARSVRLETSKDDDEDRAPTPEEQAALLDCAKIPERDRFIIAFALGAGLRPGEWRTLELADVHLDAPAPFVFVQFGSEDRGETKTGKKRKVPLLKLAEAALRAWLAQLPTFCPKNPDGLVFPTVRGRLRTNEPFGRRKEGKGGKKQINRWHEFLRFAGITRRLTPHGLRHGCATGLLTGSIGNRLEPWAVQLLIGHDKLATTERYLHHGERDLFAAVRDQSPHGPRTKTPAREKGLFPGLFAAGVGVVPTGGLEPSDQARRGLAAVPQAENDPSGTESGLNWREIDARLVAKDWPTEAEAREIAAQARAALEEADPVFRAIQRIEATTTWEAGLTDLVRLMLDRAAAQARWGGGER